MSNSENAVILQKAKSFVTEASSLIRKKFEFGFKTEEKPDSSLVTEADLEVEALLRERISQSFPDHGIIGEEGATHNPGASHTWVLDPIDGTQSFVHGIPTFGCLLAVFREEIPIVSIIDHPMLKEQYTAGIGTGSFCNNKRILIKDSPEALLDKNEVIIMCSKRQWNQSNQGDIFDKLWSKHEYFRIYYDCFGISRTIAGQCAANILMNVKHWDIAPCKLLIEEAGGQYIDLGKRSLSGKEVYSAIFGKPSACKIVKKWLGED